MPDGRLVWRSVAAKSKTIGSDDETNDDEYRGHRFNQPEDDYQKSKKKKKKDLKESTAKKVLKYMAGRKSANKKLAQMAGNRVIGHELTPLNYVFGGLN